MRMYIKISAACILFLVFVSCKKVVDIDPPKTQLTPEKAFVNDQSAIAVLSNIYAQFNSSAAIANKITIQLGIYVDELSTTSADPGVLEYYNTSVSTSNAANLNIWKGFYSVVYQCNALLDNIDISPNLTNSTKQQLKGEAKFLRAFSYFYLINIYGDVPLIVTTEVNTSSSAPRTSLVQIYDQIILDITTAKLDLQEGYPSSDKVRANKWAAVALLARVHLYRQNWSAAESAATEVIASTMYSPLNSLNSVFLSNSKETIIQFWTQNGFTVEGSILIPSATSIPTYPVSVSLINSFELADQRKTSWINSVTQGGQAYNFPFKYKNRAATSGGSGEYQIALRLGEQYLIRAEARVRLNNINGAQDDLNVIRNRAGLSNTSSANQADILTAIEQEKKIEMFCEWGHRFFDLKRSGHINLVMSALKPPWRTTSAFLPIPQYELLNNPNLSQNPGY